jgi:ribosome-associated protein
VAELARVPNDASFTGDTTVLFVSHRIQIPDSELSWSFARSGGPGGQNVNKVSSKAILDWNIVATRSLPDEVHQRLLARLKKRITRDGRLQITGQKYRDQTRNMEDCRQRLIALILTATVAPTVRKPTKPTAGARQRRLTEKRETAARKQSRRRPGRADAE